jgi:hypothetical protein
MGGSSKKQVVGYEYSMDFVSAIGCPIEDVIAFKFDDKDAIYGTKTSLSQDGMQYGARFAINAPTLYGQDEGGVRGEIRCYFGTSFQPADSKYSAYMQANSKPAVAYQGFLSYCYLDNFYIGNTKQPREMKALVKRINTRIDRDAAKWYPEKAEILTAQGQSGDAVKFSLNTIYKHSFRERPEVTETDSLMIDTFYEQQDDFFKKKLMPGSGTTGGYRRLTYIDYSVNSIDRNLLIEYRFAIRINVIDEDFYLSMPENCFLENHESHASYELLNYKGYWHTKNPFHLRVETKGQGNNGDTSMVLDVSFYQVNYYPEYSVSDLNPIHDIFEIYTDDTALNHPIADVNIANFTRAADYIYAEGLGISYSVSDANCKDLIEDICAHIHAAPRINRQTGQLEIVLFRDDWFDLNTVPRLTRSQMKNFKVKPVGGTSDNINTYNVSYKDRDKDQTIGFPVYNNAARMNAGGKEVAEDLKYDYFSNERNANLSAQRQLKLSTTAKWEGSFETPIYEARKWNRYDVIKITPNVHSITELPVRIMSIGLGDGSSSNLVSIEFEEVIPFSKASYNKITIEQPIVVDRTPVQASFIVYEATYLDLVQLLGQQDVDSKLLYEPNCGFVTVAAVKPTPMSLNSILYTNDGSGIEEVSSVHYCPSCVLDQDIDRVMTSFVIKNANRLNEVAVGAQIRIDDEIMVFMSFNATTNVVTVKRGASPSIPKPHLQNAVLYCADNFETFDLTQYLQHEIIEAKVITVAAGGVQNLDTATAKAIEIMALPYRPYPAANVKINDLLWPETLLVASDLVVTWVHRNRLQQTGGVPLGFYESGITVESGVTYSLELSTVQDGVLLFEEYIDADTFTIPEATIIPNKAHKLKVWAVRDGYQSYQAYEHNFFAESASLLLIATATSNTVIGNTVPTANVDVNIDTTTTARVQADGSRIRGKAAPGATITIEIEE